MARVPFPRRRPVATLRYRYVPCRHPVEKPRRHARWLLARAGHPRTPAAVADVVGLSAVTVRAVLHRWSARGPDGAADGRRGNGSDPKLTTRRRRALYAAVQKRPPGGGRRAGPKVARSAEGRWGVSVGPVTGWRWLRDLGLALRGPRPSRPRAADRPRRRAWGTTCDGG